MNNLETLKQELLTQKTEIEAKGGVVSVANNNPSPAEITKGIKSIEAVDFTIADATAQDVVAGKTFYSGNSELKVGELKAQSTDFTLANATEQDVMIGKTFFAGNNELKTGQFSLDEYNDRIKHIFEHQEEIQYSENRYSYYVRPEAQTLRNSMFRDNLNCVDVYFHSEITTISAHVFYNTPNFRFYNFSEMNKLNSIGAYSFESSNCDNVDFSAMPSSLEAIYQRAFYKCLKDGMSVVLPKTLRTIQQHTFYSPERVYLNSFVVPADGALTALTTYAFFNNVCNCDLNAPTINNIGTKFNYNGSFNNIILSENFTTMGDKCFSADSTVPMSDCRLKTVTYLGVTPPTIPTEPYAPQAVENGLKIYVPDQSLEAYKAKFAARYTNCIYPMSQKE